MRFSAVDWARFRRAVKLRRGAVLTTGWEPIDRDAATDARG